MAAPAGTGMDKAEMKRLLAKSKQEPVNAAMGVGADQSVALLVMDKIKQPKALEKDLLKSFPDAKNTRFGAAFVDVDIDPKKARFRINRAGPGLARKLLKTLKGTGYTKVEIVLDEDDTVVDSASSEEEEGSPAEPPAPALDAAQLTQALAALIPKIGPAVAADASRKAQLVGFATQAQAGLKGGNLPQAAGLIEQLRQALEQGAPAPAPAPAAAAAPSGAVAKTRLAWIATRKKVESEIDKLRAEIEKTYPEHASDLTALYKQKVGPVLQTLDESLGTQLDALGNAADGDRAALAAQARATVKTYQDYVAATPLIADLDDNPFVPLAIRQTVTATLGAISKSI